MPPAGKDVDPRRVQILRLRGELTLEDCLKIRNLINEYLVDGKVWVVMNLDQVNHIHLAGLPVLVDRLKRLQNYGGDLFYDTETQAAENYN